MTPEFLSLLRRQLTLWYVGLFGLLLLGFGGGLYVLIERSLLDEQQQANQRMASGLATLLKNQSSAAPPTLAQIEGELQQMAQQNSLYVAQLYDVQGHLRASWPQEIPALWQAGQNSGLTEYDRHFISWASFFPPQGSSQEIFLVGQKMDETYHVLRRLIWVISLGMPCALLVALLAGSLLAAKALRPIQQSLEEQRRFMADASHELRTPVTILMAQTEVALNKLESKSGEDRQVLETVHRTAARMKHLIAHLLTLSRADTHSLQLQRLRFEVNEWAEDMVSQWAPVAQSQGLALAFQEALAEAEVEGDPEQLSQALGNLIDNALKYTPAPGRVEVAVLLEKGKRGLPWCCVQVRDTGCGIPAAERERVFERFYRAEHTAHIPGSGLGLALAKAIAEQHGGSLIVEQDPAWRTVLTLRLPCVQQLV